MKRENNSAVKSKKEIPIIAIQPQSSIFRREILCPRRVFTNFVINPV
jgi:hypothetical protein